MRYSMETVSIARVAVAAATYTIDKPYDYTIPENLAVGRETGPARGSSWR